MRRRITPRLAFGADDGAVSAVEFALVLPILILLMFTGFQVVLYINATRRVEMVATSISEMLSQAPPPSGSTTASVSAADLHFAYDASLVLFPYLMKDAARQGIAWWQDIWIDFAGIKFTQIPGLTCPTGGDQSACYIANVNWTSTGTTGPNYRPCTPAQIPADNTASPTRYTLPRSLYGSGTIIAVDVVFTFTPTFAARFLPAITIRRSVFVQPRYATYVTYSTTNSDGIAVLCPVQT